MTAVGIATLAVAALASLFMAWAIGAGSSGSTPFAPAVGANAISVMRAGFFVGILGFAGAVLQGENVSETVGTGLIEGVKLTPAAVVTILVIAATLVAIGVFAGYPIATAFTVTGAVVGVGLALGGDPAWATYQEIVGLWVAVPFVGGGVAFLTAMGLRSADSDRITVPVLGGLVGFVLANIRFALLGTAGTQQSIATSIAVAVGGPELVITAVATLAIGLVVAGILWWDIGANPVAGQRHFLLALGGLVAFSAGGSQVGLAVGPLLPLVSANVPVVAVLLGGGIGLLVGSWTGAPRMIKALAQDYSSLGPRRSIAALIPAFLLAQMAVFAGIPVSFNEIVVSTIVGSGFAADGSDTVSARKMGFTVIAWIASLALSVGVGYAGFRGVLALLG